MNVLLRGQPPPGEQREKPEPSKFIPLLKQVWQRQGHGAHSSLPAAGATSADAKDTGGFIACLLSVMMRHANSCGKI